MSTAASSSNDDQKREEFDQRAALEHLRLLVRFIEQYLSEKVVLFEYIQAGRAEMVTCEGLWMLFSNGEKIICPLREKRVAIDFSGRRLELTVDRDKDGADHLTGPRYVPQGYRVVAVLGGAPLLSRRAATYDITRDRLLVC